MTTKKIQIYSPTGDLLHPETEGTMVVLADGTTVEASLNDYAVDVGTANAYKINLTPAPTVYKVGKAYRVKITNTNTGASTFQIGSLAVTPIKKGSNNALSGNELVSGQIVQLVYDGTNFQVIGFTTATDVLNRLLSVDGSGSGLDADYLDGIHALNFPNTQRLTSTQLNNILLKSGIYTNTGDGLLNNDGSTFIAGWWHVIHSQHWDANGYACQTATPLDQDPFSRYYRIAIGGVWQTWRKILDSRDISGVGSGTTGMHRITQSTASPSGGADGDTWFQYV